MVFFYNMYNNTKHLYAKHIISSLHGLSHFISFSYQPDEVLQGLRKINVEVASAGNYSLQFFVHFTFCRVTTQVGILK